jgi:ABC-type transporter lipoprotein component MlaA
VQGQGQEQNVVPQNMQAELNNFLNELKKPTNVTQNAMAQNAMAQNAMAQNAITTSTIDASNNNFPAANESAFGSYTPF